VSGVPADLVRELLTHSLKAWHVPGGVERDGEGVVVTGQNGKSIRIEVAQHPMFRWTVWVDSRKRGALSLVAVLRQVREVLDPGYVGQRVRVAVAPLVPRS
jgi:hypothetical protein